MKKKRILLICSMMVLILLFGLCGCGGDPQEEAQDTEAVEEAQDTEAVEEAQETKIIIDMAGREVAVPAIPKKVATMQGPSYEQVFMLGGKDQIGLVRDDHPSAYPLAALTNPDLAAYSTIAGVGPQSPVNIEEFINQGVDLVIYWPIEQELKKFDDAGIPAIVINWQSNDAANLEETISQEKERMGVLAEALGGKALERYEKWVNYIDKAVEVISERTSEIPESDFPVVFWANTWGNNVLSSYSALPLKYEIALCGGQLASIEKGGQFPEVTKEQLLSWEPEVIIVDNHGGDPAAIIEQLKTDADWADLPAVQNNRLYRNPAGVFFMDKASTRPVYYYWLAKQLHPEIFEDIDLITELKYYFKTFYNYDLRTTEAEKTLAGWTE